ncbi:hypothetical protein ABTH41_20025, partial [Acinetobacter baumannii]
ALIGKARALFRLNRAPEALLLLKQIKGPQEESFWRLRLDCCLASKNYAEAFQTCDELSKSTYPFGLSFLLRGEVYNAKGDTT